jgi:16S rRNA (guanine966-N2)-methyltransferase
MRVIAGRWKGRSLAAPTGSTTRPTADRAREAIFNVLAHAPWSQGLQDKRVLDLFAGTGALGFEALSRGASFCLFVETDEAARGAIRRSIESLDAFGETRVHRRDAADLGAKPAGLGEAFDLVFLDPPYNKGLVMRALQHVAQGGWLAPSALIVAETSSDEDLSAPGFALLDARVYGAAKVWFLSVQTQGEGAPASGSADG